MRYLCVHCDHRFEADSEQPPQRCPSCMRAKGIQPVQETLERGAPPKSKARLLAVGVAALALAAAAWLLRPRAAEDATLSRATPLSASALKEALAAQDIDAAGLEALLTADASVERFAQQSSAGKSGATAITDAVYAALREHARKLAFVPWSLGEPRATPVQTAAQTLPILQRANQRAELYPLEVSAVMVAALRARGVPAMLAELIDVPGRSAPLDPSGYLGYFVVAVFPDGNDGVPPKLYDVYGGQTLPPGVPHSVLSDTAALGAALALRALHENVYLADPRKALGSSSHALRLAGSLPSVRTVRGVVVLTEKMVEQGLQEFQAARELRADPPRLHNVANVMLVTGEPEKAQSVLSAALQKAPDFAAARATLGTLLLLQGQTEEALAELQKAERLSPKLTVVHWAFADYHMRSGDPDLALERARRAVALRPSVDAKLRLAALLRQAGKYEEMRVQAAEILAATPPYRRSELRTVLTAVLGPTALEPEQPAELDESADDLRDLGGPDLRLEAPPKLMGGGASDDSTAGPDKSKLRLRGPDEGLRLRLREQ